MRWSNVWLIFRRELRDQLRDRRTLFMIFVLPILLYPLLGLGMARLTEAFQDKQRVVVLVGKEYLPKSEGLPPLLDPSGQGFNPSLFPDADQAGRLRVVEALDAPPWTDPNERRQMLRSGEADAVVMVPRDFAASVDSLSRAEIPVAYNSADENSQITYLRVQRVLDRWNEQIVEARRQQEGKPEGYTEPVRSEAQDVATRAEAGGSAWARIFPFLLVLMALTGAFYPSVDLCAGEKERGTMETLLISPASRAEIVLGKFFTVMVASIAMALLNLLSMGLTAFVLSASLGGASSLAAGRAGGLSPAAALTPPPPLSLVWMVLILIPLSAFFSALCVALAVMARSMKEGQYYMTPLYLVALPLVFVTLMPGIDLDLFTSLLPITGVSLLLRGLIQADYEKVLGYFLIVLVPIVIYGMIALRWAIDQFKSESVLFRESERFDFSGWVRHLIHDKPARPSPGQALLCFVLMLVAAWFVTPFLGSSLWSMPVMQVIVILGLPLVLALGLTSNPRMTLRLRWPRAGDLLLGILLPIALFPLVSELRVLVDALFPTPEVIRRALEQVQAQIPKLGIVGALFVFAVAPAVCEEVAFRGYILSGFERAYRPAWAILLSAFLFGFMHVLLSLFQQLFNATLLGMVLGLLAIKSRSLLPGIVFHLINNSLGILVGTALANPESSRRVSWLFRDQAQGLFRGEWVAVASAVSLALLFKLLLMPKAPAPADWKAAEQRENPRVVPELVSAVSGGSVP
jgi:sodium transport system permease protein